MIDARILPLGPIALAPESAELNVVGARIRQRLGKATANLLEVGRELQAVRNHLQRGQFIIWLEASCGLSRRTAQLMMNAAHWAHDKSEAVTLFEPETLYLVAAPSTPKAVADAVLSRAEAGELTPPRIIREMIRAQKTTNLTENEPPLFAWMSRAKQTHEQTVLPQQSVEISEKRLERGPARTVCEADSCPNTLSNTPLASGCLVSEVVEEAPAAVNAETAKLIQIFEAAPRHTRTWIRWWVEAGAPLEDTSQEDPRTNEARAPFRAAYPEVSPASQAAFLQYVKGCPEHV